jgi:hypothetical protein
MNELIDSGDPRAKAVGKRRPPGNGERCGLGTIQSDTTEFSTHVGQTAIPQGRLPLQNLGKLR